MVPTLPHDESEIDPRTSTPDQICRALLPWAENLLHLALGPGAEEYAGLGLVDAIRHFDTARSVPFRKFAARRLVWTAREEMNRSDGRATSDPRRRLRRTSVSIDQTPGDRPLPSASLSYVPNPAARLEEHEAIAQSLRTADKLEGRHDGWCSAASSAISITTPSGGYSAVPHTTCTCSPLTFEDLGGLIDAFMLGGAQLTAPAQPSDRRYPGSVRQVRLHLVRNRWQWPTLAWGIIVLESNSLPMTLRTVDPDGSKITYRSRATNLLLRERRRWYQDRVVPAVPPDVALSDATLAVWLTGSLADDALAVRGAAPDPRRPLRLTAPAMSNLAAAHLAAQVRKHDWRCPVRPVPGTHDAEFSLNIEPCDRPDVEQWLEERVPRQAWQAVGSAQDGPEDLPDDAWDYTPPRGKPTACPRT